MATNSTAPATKVVVPCRISFANIWEARSINGGDEKYMPVIGLDGKTADGSMPYEILKQQLAFMK